MKNDRLTVTDIGQWIDNDEDLYNWWKRMRQAKSKFIQENRAELEDLIHRALNPKRPNSYEFWKV
jgi:hypothetical protein